MSLLCNCVQVHLAMVRYHEAGRFCEKDKDWDQESALFHLEQAADCGELEAIVGLGLMCSQLPHHILSEVTLEVWKMPKCGIVVRCKNNVRAAGNDHETKIVVRCSSGLFREDGLLCN